MPFVNYLSFTRATSSRVQRTARELPVFKGSSLTRKIKKNGCDLSKSKIPSASQVSGEACEEVFSDFLSKSQVSNLCINQVGELQNTRTGNYEVRKARTFSARSRNKCREKINALYSCSRDTGFSFLTLTFVQDVSHVEGQRILNKFFTVLRKHYGKFLYVWVAELQKENNDRLHFHIVVNRYMPVDRINALWLLQQYNAGLSHDVISHSDLTALYNNGRLHDIQKKLNPVKIKKVTSSNGLAAYLTMYITKNKDTFYCSVWHCCRKVSALFTHALLTNEEFEETGNTAINHTFHKNKRYAVKTFEVKDKISGILLAKVNHIYNIDAFKRHYSLIDELNAMILSNWSQKFPPLGLYVDTGGWLNKNFSPNNN